MKIPTGTSFASGHRFVASAVGLSRAGPVRPGERGSSSTPSLLGCSGGTVSTSAKSIEKAHPSSGEADALLVSCAAERELGGFPIRLPTVDLQTVGAGGGSIVWRDAGGALRVGPQSAGADPGPACYGRGGLEPTVTDAHLVLGRIPEHRVVSDGQLVIRSNNEGVPFVLADPSAPVSQDLTRIASELLGGARVPVGAGRV